MSKSERFEKVYSQGSLTVTEIWVDKETGVNYIFHASGYSGGRTVLLDKDGKPVITRDEDKRINVKETDNFIFAEMRTDRNLYRRQDTKVNSGKIDG